MEGLNFQGPSAASACEGLKHMQEEAGRAGLEVAPLKVGWYNQVCSLTSRLTSVCEENRETGKGVGEMGLPGVLSSLEFQKQCK